MTKTEVKQEVEKLLKANSLCPEGREAAQAYLEAYMGLRTKRAKQKRFYRNWKRTSQVLMI